MADMLEVLRDLQGITATRGQGCTRLAYTEFESRAHDYVWDRLRNVPGLRRVEDAAGNTFILPSTGTPNGVLPILIGSHLDTVIEGGWLDGALGIVAGMHVILHRAGSTGADPNVGLVIFRDEEGVRFNTGLFGSKVFAGLCEPEDLNVADAEGVRVRDVVPDADGCCDYDLPIHPSVFLECHIEQGIRLATSGKRIGAVNGIVGIRRFELVGSGAANHAGTTGMARRVDALVPVAAIVGRLPTLVQDLEDAVITCGRLTVSPGAPNVVPGTAVAIVEIRAGDESTLDIIEHRLEETVAEVESGTPGGTPAALTLRSRVAVRPLPTDRRVLACLDDVLTDMRVPYDTLPSMAGHDTQHAALRCKAGMFFIPSLDGISHNPAENSRDEDIRLAGEVMIAWAEACLAQCS